MRETVKKATHTPTEARERDRGAEEGSGADWGRAAGEPHAVRTILAPIKKDTQPSIGT